MRRKCKGGGVPTPLSTHTTTLENETCVMIGYDIFYALLFASSTQLKDVPGGEKGRHLRPQVVQKLGSKSEATPPPLPTIMYLVTIDSIVLQDQYKSIPCIDTYYLTVCGQQERSMDKKNAF